MIWMSFWKPTELIIRVNYHATDRIAITDASLFFVLFCLFKTFFIEVREKVTKKLISPMTETLLFQKSTKLKFTVVQEDQKMFLLV